MKLTAEKFNINNYNSRYKRSENNVRKNFSSSKDVAFTGTFEKIVRGVSEVIYSDISTIQPKIDEILGDKYLSTTLKKAGIAPLNDKITFKNKNFIQQIFTTIAYPFIKLPLDITNFLLKGLKKIPFLSNFATSLMKLKPLAKRAAEVEREKSYECAKALLERFASEKSLIAERDTGIGFSKFSKNNVKTTTYDVDTSLEVFKDRAATDIIDLAKNYTSRDERTLNRMATSLVSALYSARDFYNISMLQKDNDKEAKKAEHSRLKQELTRMGMSAGLTFVSLGALSKYTKNSIVLNSLVIAGSAFASEVGSRLLSGTPLKPLSPEKAKEIAQKEKAKKETTMLDLKKEASQWFSSISSPKNTMKNQSFKGNNPEQIENNKTSLFDDFAQSNNPYANVIQDKTNNSISQENKQNINTTTQNNVKPKKKSGAKALVIGLFSIASAAFLAKKAVTGEYAQKITNMRIYNKNYEFIDPFVADKTKYIDQKVVDRAKAAAKKRESNSALQLIKKLEAFWDDIDYKQVPFDAASIEKRVKELEKLPEGKEIAALLDEYVRQAKAIETGSGKGVVVYTKRELVGGIRRGLEKLVNTLYSIFSLPGAIIDLIANKIWFARSENAIGSILKKTSQTKGVVVDTKTRKGISLLAQTIFENQERGKELNTFSKRLRRNQRTDREIIAAIKKNTRNFELGSETGALANLSRTMVTLITSYFFVNDYRNKVLIESEGKDIEKANEEGKERIAHKVANFIINGTLMNLFNSVFKKPLNASLFGATLVAAATETTNEYMVRKSICQPTKHMKSRQEILDYEQQQENRTGFAGAWTRMFRKITGKKSLSEKVNEQK